MNQCAIGFRLLLTGWLLLCFGCFGSLAAQAFNGRGGVIQDFRAVDQADTFVLRINGLNFLEGEEIGLVKACVNIHHRRVSDLKLTLINPAGEEIWLSNRNGGETGFDYTNTCFSRTGFFGYIHEGESPFNGTYLPDGRFEQLHTGRSQMEGDWKLVVHDLRSEVTGLLSSWNLYFGRLPPPPPPRCSEDNPENCVTDTSVVDSVLLPDLVMLPAFSRNQFIEYPPDHPNFPRQIKFAATIANVGYGPMETRGTGRWSCNGELMVDGRIPCADGTSPRQEVVQRIYRIEDNRIAFTDIQAGTNYLDLKPGHNHFHVDDWVEYQLLQVDAAGEEIIVCEGRKVSYCLFDSGACQDQDSLCAVGSSVYGPENLPNYGFGRYPNCHEDIQGISVGGYDTYGSMYEGQSLTLPVGAENGEYILQITVDPYDRYREHDEENNVMRVKVHLTEQVSQKD